MLSIISNIRFFSVASIIAIAIQGTCYAGFFTTTEEINLQCAPNEEEATSMSFVYPGEHNTYLSITTKGIRVTGKEEFVTPKTWNWDDGHALISAECTMSGGVTNAMDMFPFLGRKLNFLPTLRCNRGEGIRVTMYKPNSLDPNEYQYIADLAIDRMVRKKRVPSTNIPWPSIKPDSPILPISLNLGSMLN